MRGRQMDKPKTKKKVSNHIIRHLYLEFT
jgi:hypothetical protein